jgi:GT2 family glycosyltransferase
MDVSIVVVAWNVKRLLFECLQSVYSETRGIEFEIIYVDNASSDGSVQMVREHFPQVTIIENPDNKGFIRANNQAIEIARGRYVLLLNSDTLILRNAITKVVEFSDQHADAAVVGCRVLNPDHTLQGNCFRFYSTLNMLFDAVFLSRVFPNSRLFGRKTYSGWKYDSAREVDVVVGCFSLVRQEAIKQVGMMDETFFTYGDDIDWCWRFAKAGWKVWFTPVAEIIHYGGQTTKQSPSAFTLQLFGAYLLNVRKHYPYRTFVISRLLTALHFLTRAFYWSVRALIRNENRSSALAWARTMYRGTYYCLCDWTGLLMNRRAVEARLSRHSVRTI